MNFILFFLNYSWKKIRNEMKNVLVLSFEKNIRYDLLSSWQKMPIYEQEIIFKQRLIRWFFFVVYKHSFVRII